MEVLDGERSGEVAVAAGIVKTEVDCFVLRSNPAGGRLLACARADIVAFGGEEEEAADRRGIAC